MPRAAHPCAKCGEPVRGRCPKCQQQGDRNRGSFAERGYTSRHRTTFRAGVLRKNPTCVCANATHGHDTPCGEQSTDADHWPLDRRELVAQGLDPDDPKHGRGLCHSCHSKHTAQVQPGGWNRRRA